MTFAVTDLILVALIWFERDARRGRWVFPAVLALFVFSQLPVMLGLVEAQAWEAFSRWYRRQIVRQHLLGQVRLVGRRIDGGPNTPSRADRLQAADRTAHSGSGSRPGQLTPAGWSRPRATPRSATRCAAASALPRFLHNVPCPGGNYGFAREKFAPRCNLPPGHAYKRV